MRDAIATSELFVEEPGQPRRSLIVAIAAPQRTPDDTWCCRVKMTAGRFDAEVESYDSLHAIARAIEVAREHLVSLRVEGWLFFESADAPHPTDPERFGLEGAHDRVQLRAP